MILLNYYWQFEGALSKQLCKRIIKLGLAKKVKKSETGEFPKNKLKSLEKRDSSVAWLDNSWIYTNIHPATHAANKNAGWNYQWDRTEDIQFGVYKKNQFYGWHTDQGSTSPANSNRNALGKIRKLTSSVQLSDPDTYEGGGIQLDPRDDDPELSEKKSFIDLSRKQGTIICFPSHIWHRAMPVTKGTRYSLTLWHLGHPFR